ncbi:hypothetical protein [Terriglobus aquaticus]|uniref:CAAX protease self-immunity n=1 Tax=Terriglobus aquaticus TaxID=940139 RepID=A0ABW9KJ54_9BACT|nr:hypothetical protein [Terriglobus aquaticus]
MPTSAGGAAPATGNNTAGRAAVTFLLCAIYFSGTMALTGVLTHIVDVLRPGGSGPLLGPLLNLVLLVAGLLAIARMRVPELRPLSALGLVRRPSATREAGLGAAVGWAIAVALVLPGVLLLRMRSSLSLDGFHLGAATASILALLLFVLARQLVLCGLPFQALSRATSPTFATIAFACVAALLTSYTAGADGAEAIVASMAQVVFCLAAARTRAIWLGGALQFVWGLCITELFGLPSFLWPPATSLVRSGMQGPRWLTGDGFGPEATLWAVPIVILSAIAVWRLTRDYAWYYTFDPITGAGYPMDVAPPPEHTRMEQASQAAPLIQIGGIGSHPGSPASSAGDTEPRI